MKNSFDILTLVFEVYIFKMKQVQEKYKLPSFGHISNETNTVNIYAVLPGSLMPQGHFLK